MITARFLGIKKQRGAIFSNCAALFMLAKDDFFVDQGLPTTAPFTDIRTGPWFLREPSA